MEVKRRTNNLKIQIKRLAKSIKLFKSKQKKLTKMFNSFISTENEQANKNMKLEEQNDDIQNLKN